MSKSVLREGNFQPPWTGIAVIFDSCRPGYSTRSEYPGPRGEGRIREYYVSRRRLAPVWRRF